MNLCLNITRDITYLFVNEFPLIHL